MHQILAACHRLLSIRFFRKGMGDWHQMTCLLRYPKGLYRRPDRRRSDLDKDSNETKLDLLLWECDCSMAFLP